MLRFLDVETNPGPRRPVPDVCRILCSNVRGLAGNHSDQTVASYQYDILFCSETLVPDTRHVSELHVPGFGRLVSLCWGKMLRARGMAAYVQNLYKYNLYRNPDIDDQIFYCLLASMAAVQAEDVRASFLFVGDLNGHHQKWLSSTTRTVKELLPLTSQLCLVAISWLSARPIHVVEHLPS